MPFLDLSEVADIFAEVQDRGAAAARSPARALDASLERVTRRPRARERWRAVERRLLAQLAREV